MIGGSDPVRFNSGEKYEPYVGRWSRLAARDFIRWLHPKPGMRWLDIGCGTGAVTEAILQLSSPLQVLGIDPSAAFVAYAASHLTDRRVKFEVGDAQALPGGLTYFDVTVTGLVLNFIPDREEALRQMVRVTRPGGTVAAYVWDYAEGMELMRCFWDVATKLDPAAADLDEGRRVSVCNLDALTELFSHFLHNVEVVELIVPTVFSDFGDYWSPFLGGQGSAPNYVASLDDDHRERLETELRHQLPYASDGSISLSARALGVRGTTPG